MSQVDGAGEGFKGTKLSYLASQCGFFFESHRAENDCLAGLETLTRPWPAAARPRRICSTPPEPPPGASSPTARPSR